jgi:hypothetical protein
MRIIILITGKQRQNKLLLLVLLIQKTKMRSLYKTQSRRDEKCELKWAETKLSTNHSSSPILKRKRGPSRCTEITTPEIPDSTISESSENPGSSSETRGSAQQATVHRWNHSNNFKRRFKQDCHKVRRLFHRSNCINNILVVPDHGDQLQPRKKSTASDEQLREHHGSMEFFVNESLRLVKNLTLVASPTATSSTAYSSASKY